MRYYDTFVANDTFIRPRQKHKQHRQYNIQEIRKNKKKLDKSNVREVPKQTFVNMSLGLIKCFPEFICLNN